MAKAALNVKHVKEIYDLLGVGDCQLAISINTYLGTNEKVLYAKNKQDSTELGNGGKSAIFRTL